MKKGTMIYEGKAKKMFTTEDTDTLIIEYKNSLTAFNAQKRSSLEGKGELNNLISIEMFELLHSKGVESHFIRKLDDTHQLVKRVEIVPVEVVTRNITTGSLCKRLGVEEGIELPEPLVELYLKSDELGDPLILPEHALLFGWATKEDLSFMKETALKVNSILTDYFRSVGIVLVDFKLEFGKDKKGSIMLADEISPDTCRFWDLSSKEKLDKDRFRKDLGNILEAYREIYKRITAKKEG
jgi:phosphoribosylaminoimidazole-succinocarboxamide synthase